jgi:hypothetical protein
MRTAYALHFSGAKNKAQNATFLPTQRPQKQISVAVA